MDGSLDIYDSTVTYIHLTSPSCSFPLLAHDLTRQVEFELVGSASTTEGSSLIHLDWSADGRHIQTDNSTGVHQVRSSSSTTTTTSSSSFSSSSSSSPLLSLPLLSSTSFSPLFLLPFPLLLLLLLADSGLQYWDASSMVEQVGAEDVLARAEWHTWTCVSGWLSLLLSLASQTPGRSVQGLIPKMAEPSGINAVARSHRRDVLAVANDFGLVVCKPPAGGELTRAQRLYRYPCPYVGSKHKRYAVSFPPLPSPPLLGLLSPALPFLCHLAFLISSSLSLLKAC
eukprot:759683-Hanusia_phi.AAC.11